MIYVYLNQMVYHIGADIFYRILLHFIHYDIIINQDNFFNNVLTSTIQLLAVVEPFGIIPILINLTKKMEKETSKALSKTAAVTS